MSTEKKSALELLEDKHLKDTQARRARIEAASEEVNAARKLLKDAIDKVALLQHDQLNASFAFDAARAELEAAEKKAKEAA